MAIRFPALTAEDIEVRVNQCTEKGVSLLLYKDARCDMRCLDAAVGPEGWSCRYERIGDTLFCDVSIRCGDDGSWVSKSDCGVPSNMESEKGEASDAFKRACFKWGIGRELYTAPRIWVPSDRCSIKQGRNGKPACYDRFYVSDIAVEDGRIAGLEVVNASTGDAVYPCAPRKARKGTAGDPAADSKRRLWSAIGKWAELHGKTPREVLEGVRKRPDWSEDAGFFDSVAKEFEDDLPG